MTSLENPSTAAPKPVAAGTRRAFAAVALVLINGCIGYAGGYAQRDISASRELEQEKLRSVERLREAFACDSKPSAPRCAWLDYERDQIRSRYTIGATPG
jgi:hypothetical protein